MLLRLQKVNEARAHVIDHPNQATLKPFCQELRAAKLRFLNHDRQEPLAFDQGAGLLIEWADEVLTIIELSSSIGLIRVRNGIQSHRDELALHLEVPQSERPVIK